MIGRRAFAESDIISEVMLIEYALDNYKLRFALCAFVPFLFCISLVSLV